MTWLKQGGHLTNLNCFPFIVKGWYFASDYDAKYGYDKDHDKPMIRFLDIKYNEIDKLLFSNEADRDSFFDKICESLQKPNSVLEYDYEMYNKVKQNDKN